MPAAIYIGLSVISRKGSLLDLNEKGAYIVLRILGFVLGQAMGFGLAHALPILSVSSSFTDLYLIILCYLGRMIGSIACAQLLRMMVKKKLFFVVVGCGKCCKNRLPGGGVSGIIKIER